MVSGDQVNLASHATSARPQAPQRGGRASLALLGILIGFVALSTVIAVKTPAYESADEPDHVENVETLVSGNWYGMHSLCGWHPAAHPPYSGPDCSGTEAGQPPLYYLLLAGVQKALGLPIHSVSNVGGATSFGTQNGLFPHHSASTWRFLLPLRLFNILLGALTVIVTFFAIKEITADPWSPAVGAATVAFLPRFVFLSAFVTNDNLVITLGACLTLTAVRYVKAPSSKRIALVGAVFGFMVATKLSSLPVGLVLVVPMCVNDTWFRRAKDLSIGLLASLATCGWYLVQNVFRYGDPLAAKATPKYLAQVGGLGIFPPAVPYVVTDPLYQIFVRVPRHILDTFWYQSGWNQFHWSWQVSVVYWLVFVAALFGLVIRRVERWTLLTLITISVMAFLSVWIVAFQTASYEARYALVGIAAVASLVALGVERWRLPIRFVLPAMGLCGTLVAVQQNVLAVHWGT